MSRRGGVSRGVFAELNLAGWIDDEPAAVDANWRRWHATLSRGEPARLKQVHGNGCSVIDDHPGDRASGRRRDGHDPSWCSLCIFTADCVPILLIDPVNQVVGALHSGWRSTIAESPGSVYKR